MPARVLKSIDCMPDENLICDGPGEHLERQRTTSSRATKVGFVSLGCPKNLVDSEVMMGMLAQAGAELVSGAEDADVIVVNTCSFIASAQQESVNTILEMARHKTEGRAAEAGRGGLPGGTFPQRHSKEHSGSRRGGRDGRTGRHSRGCRGSAGALRKQIPRSGFCSRGPKAMRAPHRDVFRARPGTAPSATCPTIFTTKQRRACWPLPATRPTSRLPKAAIIPARFCIIPQLRGKFRSRRFESVIAEAERLAQSGVREITLIGQDTTCYGEDFGLKDGLALLLEKLAGIEDLRWVRFLYAYPNKITGRLLETIAAHEKICSYIDVPLQHASPSVLKRMKRGGGRRYFPALD